MKRTAADKPVPAYAGTPNCPGWDDPADRCPLKNARERCQCWKRSAVQDGLRKLT